METTLAQNSAVDIKRFVCFGPESTGKTTLTRGLSEYFGEPYVAEYMREYLQEKWNTKKETCTWDDLLPIAVGQIQTENEQAEKASKFIICDTDLLELMTYAHIYYDEKCPPEIEKYAQLNQYDFYFLTDIDVPWEADDLRDRPNDRQFMFEQFKNTLEIHKKPYITLRGNAQQRLQIAVEIVHKIIKNNG